MQMSLTHCHSCVPVPWSLKNSSIDSGEAEVGRRVTQEVPPGVFWRSQIHISQPQFLKFNISLGKDALFGVYIRRGLPPSHAQVWPHLMEPSGWHIQIHCFVPTEVPVIKTQTTTRCWRNWNLGLFLVSKWFSHSRVRLAVNEEERWL